MLIKSDPPTAQRRSPRRHQGQATGGRKIQPGMQESSRKPTELAGTRKQKLVLSDDDDDDNTSNKGAAGKQPKTASQPKKKTIKGPIPKIRKSSRYEHVLTFVITSS